MFLFRQFAMRNQGYSGLGSGGAPLPSTTPLMSAGPPPATPLMGGGGPPSPAASPPFISSSLHPTIRNIGKSGINGVPRKRKVKERNKNERERERNRRIEKTERESEYKH